MAGHQDGFQYYHYDPSLGAAALFTTLFFIFTLLHLYQLARTRTWVFIPFVLGGLFEAVGYIGRIMSANQTPNWTLGPYIQQSLLILVAPALFAASIYMVLGRIILLTDGEEHSFIRKKWLTKVFVTGDIVSFFTVGGGGGIMATGNGQNENTGRIVIEIGLALQILFFGFFVITAGVFHWRMNKVPTSKVRTGGIPWKKHMRTLYAASLLILVRSIFRIIEYSQGNNGYLLSQEVFLYVFDAVLMLAVMAVFAWIHPSEIYAMLKGGPRAKAVRKVVQVYNLEFRELESPHSMAKLTV